MLCSIYDVIKDGNKCIAVDLEGNEFAELIVMQMIKLRNINCNIDKLRRKL